MGQVPHKWDGMDEIPDHEFDDNLHRRNFTPLPIGWKVTQLMDLKKILEGIAARDVQTLVTKDAEYGSSWKRRGGVGAFMMLARKWDRLENQVQRPSLDSKYDVFDLIAQDSQNPAGTSEQALETIRDLRRYLMLVESEMIARKVLDNYGVADEFPKTSSGVADFTNTGSVVTRDER